MEWIMIVAVISVSGICYVIWQYLELKKFSIKECTIATEKLRNSYQYAILSDLHGFVYGKKNQRLLQSIKKSSPDLILIAGDLIVGKKPETFGIAQEFLEELVKIAPVYYAFGNHESKAMRKDGEVYQEFQKYLSAVKKLGVHVLRNETKIISCGVDKIHITGVEIESSYFTKGKQVPMDITYLPKLLGTPETSGFQILLAHHPAYSIQYATWGADVTFCGHNHGGLVRIPGLGSVLSPQLTFFPQFDKGIYEIQGKKVIVSGGLGTHTFHIRIFNRAELLMIKVQGSQKG